MNSSLVTLDWIVLLFYGAIVVLIGIYAGRREKNTDDYFLGGRRMPWWAVMISIYATSLSALTFIGVPSVAYVGDYHYLQLGLGDLAGRVFVAYFLLTAYYRHNISTVYEFLGKRFGPRSRDAGTAFFIITRLLASGVRLAGCAIALAIVFQLPTAVAVCMIASTALAYTLVGGIKAVIWTDVLQFVLFIGAALIAIGTIICTLPSGWSDFIQIGQTHNKFKVIHFSFSSESKDYWLNFANPQSFIAGLLFGCFSTFAALGTDQDLVQRMLTCKKVGESQKALLLTAILNFPITLLFLGVGTALFAYYNVFPSSAVLEFTESQQTDKIFPYFIKTVLDPGLRGLLIAGLIAAAMSSLDSALNALASTTYIDVIQRYAHATWNDGRAVKTSRYLVFVFAVLLASIAIFFCNTESILWLGFRIVGYTYGGLLGIFLLAVTTSKRGNDGINLFAMTSSVGVVIFLTADTVGPLNSFRQQLLAPLAIKAIAWPWAILIGAGWTFGLGVLFRTKEPGR